MNYTRYKVKHTLGSMGDFGREYWTDDDYKKWDEYIKKLKATGEYGKEIEVTWDLIHNPMYDDVKITSPITSYSFGFLDFGKT